MIATSNAKTLDGIRMRKQNRNLNASKDPRYVVGVDTETDNGDIFLIADSDGNYLDNKITFERIAEFLFKHEGEWIFFYNLSYDQMRRAFDSDRCNGTLPATAVMPRTESSGDASARRIAKASSWPGSVSITMGRGVINEFPSCRLADERGTAGPPPDFPRPVSRCQAA